MAGFVCSANYRNQLARNITTFIDTSWQLCYSRTPDAFTVVFVEMLSITILGDYPAHRLLSPNQRGMLWWSEWISANCRWNLAIFMVTIFVIPIVLLLIRSFPTCDGPRGPVMRLLMATGGSDVPRQLCCSA